MRLIELYSWDKFTKSAGVQKKLKKYTIEYVENFLTYFNYEFLTQDYMSSLWVEENSNLLLKEEGFKFFLIEGTSAFYLECRHFLIFSTPEKFLSDFEKFLDLGMFYDGKITKDI